MVLDISLTIILLTLFSKNFFGLFYHEVVGLAVLIPILVHIFSNLKMVRGMCKNFKRVPMNIKICLIVDGLLLLTFVWMGISGVLISKTILTSISTTNGLMKLYHMCMGGLSVILLGIHIGLHICRKEMRTKVAVVLTSLAVAGGIYGISSSELVRWVGMPFRAATSSHLAVEREVPFGEHSGQGQGESNLIQKINVFIQFFGLMFGSAMATYWVVIWKKRGLSDDTEYLVAYGI